MAGNENAVVLWRPTGPAELRLVAESGWQRWPPRLPHQLVHECHPPPYAARPVTASCRYRAG